MKKYTFEAARRQWEKPTEPKSRFCAKASVTVLAEDETQAIELADRKLTQAFFGTGTLLEDLTLVAVSELPADWNYGYGDARGTGTAEERALLTRENTK